MTVIIGVLALQGAFFEHIQHFKRCIDEHNYANIDIIPVRNEIDLYKCDSLVIPGGESTSMSLIAQRTGLFEHLYNFVHDPSKTIWGTCAGLIFLSKELSSGSELVKTLKLVEIRVKRNAFGRQTHSFTKDCNFSSFIPGCSEFPAVFIRAPVIEKVLDSKKVDILYTLAAENSHDLPLIVAARQNKNILVTSFHPELADDDIRFHNWFIQEFVLPYSQK